MIQSKLPNVATSIFTEMTALANAKGAINLSQGFPGFEPDSVLVERLAYYAANGKNQYAAASGIVELRNQLSIKYGYNPESEITVTSGASEALFTAISTVVSEADEVIIIEPAYDLYAPAVQLNGGVPIFVKLKYPDFTIDWQEVSDSVSDKTRLIIVNTPHNPTGKVLQNADITALEEIVNSYPNLYIVSDEVYEHIVFDERIHLSLRESEILKSRTFLCSSFAKTFHITGWKVGYCLAPAELTREFRKIHQFNTFCTFTPAQYAIADYLEGSKEYEKLSEFYKEKRDIFLKAIEGSFFKPIKSEGTFFQNVSYHGLSDLSDVELSKKLIDVAGVASIPTSVFYSDKTDHKILRFCFAKDDHILISAGERLSALDQIL